MFTKFAASLLVFVIPAMAAPPWAGGPTITTKSPLPAASVGIPYATTFTATGGKTPYRWTILDTPPGLSFNSGTLSGVPLVANDYSLSVVVVDSKNQSKAASFVLPVNPGPLTIIVPPGCAAGAVCTLTPGMVGVAYQFQVQATGGTPPYTCTPDPDNNLAEFGLTMTPDCWVRGTPTKAGDVHF